MVKVALVDDHALLRSGLASVIKSFGEFSVVFEADNGKQFIEQLNLKEEPNIVLLDVNMPVMNGFETAKWIKENRPSINVLVLTMRDDDESIIRMLQFGARGYFLKDSRPETLRRALSDVAERGFHFNDLVSGKLLHHVTKNPNEKTGSDLLSEKEIDFLKWCCTEKSYKEIADAMHISPRAVEALRSNLFEKLETLSRVGLVMYAIRNGIIQV